MAKEYKPFTRERIGQLITIYGNQLEMIPDTDFFSRKTLCSHGLIITIPNYDGVYILTTRALFGCGNIFGYYSIFVNRELHVFKNDLKIVYHIPEFNLMILATRNSETFDRAESVSLTKSQIKETNSGLILCDNSFSPSKESTHYIMQMDMCMESSRVEFQMNIQKMTFTKSSFVSNIIKPLCHYYVYDYPDNINDSVTGCAVFNSKMKVVGLVDRVLKKSNGDKEVKVIPSYLINKLLIFFMHPEPPFSMNFNAEEIKLIKDKNVVDGCIIEEGVALPLELWLSINYRANDEIEYFSKKSKGVLKHEATRLKISSSERCNPSTMYPTRMFADMQLIELSHEVINCFYQNGYVLDNPIVDDIMNGIVDQYLMIIPTESLATSTTKQNLDVSILTHINGERISDFEELKECDFSGLITVTLVKKNSSVSRIIDLTHND